MRGADDVLYAFGPFIADPVMGVLRRNGQAVTLTLKSLEVENASERVYSPVNTMELAIAPHQLILPIVEASAAVWVLENVER